MKPAVWMWCARVAWAVLPIAAGGAFGGAIASWPTGPARLAAVLLWAAWATGLLALFAPRPWGCTLLRVVAPLGVVGTICAFSSTSPFSGAAAIVVTTLASVLALGEPVVAASGNALAYGDELRFPLHIPTPLLLGPVPLAIALVGAGATIGPLLLADARIVSGIVCTVVGVPVAALLVRSLHALSRRWIVLVPAGIAIADALTLVDSVLLPRNVIAVVRRIPATPLRDGLDLRLGAVTGGIAITFSESGSFARRRGRGQSEIAEANAVAVSVTRANEFLARAQAATMPPPQQRSPS